MFSRIPVTLAISVLAACPLLAVATPWASPTTKSTSSPAPTASPSSSCNTGAVQCCNSVQPSNSSEASTLLGLLGVVISGVTVPIGITCDPISILGAGGSSCNAQTVCCQNNSFHGVIAIGCTPINL